MLGDQHRLEATLAIARHLDAHGTFVGQHRLGAGAVAMVARVLGLGRAGRVAQVVPELGAERALDQRAFLNAIDAALTASALIGGRSRTGQSAP